MTLHSPIQKRFYALSLSVLFSLSAAEQTDAAGKPSPASACWTCGITGNIASLWNSSSYVRGTIYLAALTAAASLPCPTVRHRLVTPLTSLESMAARSVRKIQERYFSTTNEPTLPYLLDASIDWVLPTGCCTAYHRWAIAQGMVPLHKITSCVKRDIQELAHFRSILMARDGNINLIRSIDALISKLNHIMHTVRRAPGYLEERKELRCIVNQEKAHSWWRNVGGLFVFHFGGK